MEDYETNRPSSGNSGGGNKPICKQEEGNEGERGQRKGDEYDDLVILSGRGREEEEEWRELKLSGFR